MNTTKIRRRYTNPAVRQWKRLRTCFGIYLQQNDEFYGFIMLFTLRYVSYDLFILEHAKITKKTGINLSSKPL